MKNLFTVSLNQEKIILKPDERITKGFFKTLRHAGWLWSKTLNAFVFTKNEEGVKRVKALEDQSIVNSLKYYFSTEEEREEVKNEILETSINYDNEETEEFINNLQNERLAKIEKEKAERKQKEDHANEERAKRYNKIVEQLKTLKNGFGCDMFNLANSNFNLSDLLARSGVRVDYSVKELANKFNYVDNDNLINDNDILEFSIRYGNNYGELFGKVTSKYLSFEVDHYTKSSTTTFMNGGSGHFRLVKVVLDNEQRINFKNVVKLSELITDEVLEICFNQYIAFVKGEIAYKQTVNSFGMITEKIINNECLDFLKNQFLEG